MKWQGEKKNCLSEYVALNNLKWQWETRKVYNSGGPVTGVWLTIPKTFTFTALLPWKEKKKSVFFGNCCSFLYNYDRRWILVLGSCFVISIFWGEKTTEDYRMKVTELHGKRNTLMCTNLTLCIPDKNLDLQRFVMRSFKN